MTAPEIAGAVAWLVAVGAIACAARTASRRYPPAGPTDADGRSAAQLARLREFEGAGLHRASDGNDH